MKNKNNENNKCKSCENCKWNDKLILLPIGNCFCRIKRKNYFIKKNNCDMWTNDNR